MLTFNFGLPQLGFFKNLSISGIASCFLLLTLIAIVETLQRDV